MLNKARQRAKKKGVPFALIPSDIHIPERCPVFGFPLLSNWGGQPTDYSPSLDRIEPWLGYVHGNVIVVSHRANRLKGDATLTELQQLVKTYKRLAKKRENNSTH